MVCCFLGFLPHSISTASSRCSNPMIRIWFRILDGAWGFGARFVKKKWWGGGFRGWWELGIEDWG